MTRVLVTLALLLDVESIARLGLLAFKSGLSVSTLKGATYAFTVN